MMFCNFWKKLSFRNKIMIGFLLIIFLLSSLSFSLSQYIADVSTVGQELVDYKVPELLWVSQWQKEVYLKRIVLERFVEEGSPAVLNEYERSKHNPGLVGKAPPTLKDTIIRIEHIDFIYENKIKGLVKYNNLDTARKMIKRDLLPKMAELETHLQRKNQQTQQSLLKKSEKISHIIVHALFALFVVSAFALLLSVYFSYNISSSLTKPIGHLIRKVRRISDGEYGLQVPPIDQYEMGKLTKSINHMSSRLEESFDTLYKEKLFREKILASIPIGIITVNDEKNEIQINDKAKELIGLDEKGLDKRLSGDIEGSCNYDFWGWYHCKEFFETRKATLVAEQGSYETLVSQAPLVDYDERSIGRIFYFIDISKIDALEKRIHRSEKLALVGEIAAGSAHEVRNPLSVIQGFIQLIHNDLSDDERKKYHLPLILQELERINKIIEDMLMLARPGTPQKTSGSINDILDEIMPLIGTSCPANISIHTQVDFSKKILLDSGQMKQVFYNLVRNSIEALDDENGGRIDISSSVEDERVCIFIADNGPGIPKEVQPTVFEPFVSSKETGTGLGLTIIQRIIENHDGSIELVSSSDQGTTFKVSLPIHESLNSPAFGQQ